MAILASRVAGQPPGANKMRAPPMDEPRKGFRNEQFSDLFRLFLSAVEHEVGNSLTAFRILAELRDGEGEHLVQKMVDDYARLQFLGKLAARPADAAMERDYSVLFPDGLTFLQGLDDNVRIIQVRCLGSRTTRSLRSSLAEAESVFRESAAGREDLQFHFDRVMVYGRLLCDALEKLSLGDFDFSSEFMPQMALGKGSVVHVCEKMADEAALEAQFCEIDASLCRTSIVSNPLFLRLILANIYSNAKRACETAGTEPLVRIYATHGKGTVCFCFADSGCGMGYETITKLNSGIPVSTKTGDGHGIGFSYCRSLAEKLGGQLYVEYSKPGNGTVVVLELKVTN